MDWAEIEFDDDDIENDDIENDDMDDADIEDADIEDGDIEDNGLQDSSDEPAHADVDSDASYVCDNCGEDIVIPIDMAAGQEQSYVEDCPVCCSPSIIHVYVDEDRVDVRAEPEQDRY